jgi:hypothetical protein
MAEKSYMTHRLGAADLLDRTIAPGQNLFIDHSDEAAIFAKRPRLLPVGCHIAAQPIAPGVPPARRRYWLNSSRSRFWAISRSEGQKDHWFALTRPSDQLFGLFLVYSVLL